MLAASTSPEDRLLPLLDRLQRLDAESASRGGESLSQRQRALLAALAADPGCSLQTLTTALCVSPPTASVAAARAEAAGWLQRAPDPHDRRAIRLSLTAQGEALLRRTDEARRARAAQILSPLSPEERVTLVDLLARALSYNAAAEPPSAPRGLAAIVRRARALWPRRATP